MTACCDGPFRVRVVVPAEPGIVRVVMPGPEGPPGPPGEAGRPGQDGDGAAVDPGDLTLIFNNKLI